MRQNVAKMSWRRESWGGPRSEDSVPVVESREAFMEEMAFDLNFVGCMMVCTLGRKEGENMVRIPPHCLTCPCCPCWFLSLFSTIIRVALHLLTLIFRRQWLVGFPLRTDHLFWPFPVFFFLTLLPPTPNPTINGLDSWILHFRFWSSSAN